MRISDWSSDVCSSDLLACLRFDLPQADRSRCRCLHLRVQRADPEEASGLAVAWERIVANLSLHHLIEKIGRASCRERVVSVRVDLGGRRIIKKKNVIIRIVALDHSKNKNVLNQ